MTLADGLEALAARATADTLMMYGEPDVGLRTEPFFGEPLKGNMRPLADWAPMDAELVVRLWNNIPIILSALRAREPSDEMVERVARALFDDHWQDDPELIVVPWSDDHGNCICEIEREAWRRAARAAIHAMENSDAG